MLLPKDVRYRNPTMMCIMKGEKVPKDRIHEAIKKEGLLEDARKKLFMEVKRQAKRVREADLELQKREEVLALASKAPTVKEMRAATSQLFREYDLSPIKELIELSRKRGKDALSAKDRMALLKFLAEYEAPRPKSVDIQQDTNMNISVGMVDFRHIKSPQTGQLEVLTDEDYEEFGEAQDG